MQLHSPPESWSIAIQGARLNRYGRVNNSPLAPTLLFLLMTNDKNMKSPTYLDTILLRTHTISICYLLCLFPTVSSVMNDTTVNHAPIMSSLRGPKPTALFIIDLHYV